MELEVMQNGLLKNRTFRQLYHAYERTIPFVKVCLSRDGFFSSKGRTLIWGKFRRLVISSIPPLARMLQKHYGLTGGCSRCGASCRLLFQCPHYDERRQGCSVYEDRPSICRTFPITPGDIRDRNLVMKDKPCGFNFSRRSSD